MPGQRSGFGTILYTATIDAQLGPDHSVRRDDIVLSGRAPEYLNSYRFTLPGYLYRRERHGVMNGDQNIKRQYIVADNDRKVGVVFDIETFEKIEELLEDCGLALSMEEVEEEESLSLNEAQERYAQMKKR